MESLIAQYRGATDKATRQSIRRQVLAGCADKRHNLIRGLPPRHKEEAAQLVALGVLVALEKYDPTLAGIDRVNAFWVHAFGQVRKELVIWTDRVAPGCRGEVKASLEAGEASWIASAHRDTLPAPPPDGCEDAIPRATYSLAQGDVLDVLRGYPDGSFDALFCDPPYGVHFRRAAWDYEVPGVSLWTECLRVLKPGAPLLACGGSRTYHRLATAIEDAGFELFDSITWIHAQGKPPTPKHLRPAKEHMCWAHKPGETAPRNVNACRIGEAGRWPPNVAVDEDVAADLDATHGVRTSRPFRENVAAGSVLNLRRRTAGGYSDSGGVSRYFFCTKAASRERDAGVPAGSPRHPCIKPLSLTTWLARLILPPTPGAVVLVPFAGTGSEMIGALQAGWAHVVGIEREAEYVATARARLAHWCPASAGASPPACGESETGI